MKKLAFAVVLLSLVLSACGTASTGTASSPNSSAAAERSMSPITQIVIGTFKLEGTPQAVTAQQAAELLPLWEVYGSLTQSDTAAQAEIDGLIEQIQDTMSKEQMQAIQDMSLTPQDMFAVMRDQGIEQAGPNGQNLSAAQIATAQARRNSGGGAGIPGGVPGGGGGFPGGGFPGGRPDGGGATGNRGPQSTGSGTPQARAGLADRVPTALLDALVDLLKKRAAS